MRNPLRSAPTVLLTVLALAALVLVVSRTGAETSTGSAGSSQGKPKAESPLCGSTSDRKGCPAGDEDAGSAAVMPTTAASTAAEDKHALPVGKPWRIQGDLSEACTCSVPCTCNFGAGP